MGKSRVNLFQRNINPFTSSLDWNYSVSLINFLDLLRYVASSFWLSSLMVFSHNLYPGSLWSTSIALTLPLRNPGIFTQSFCSFVKQP